MRVSTAAVCTLAAFARDLLRQAIAEAAASPIYSLPLSIIENVSEKPFQADKRGKNGADAALVAGIGLGDAQRAVGLLALWKPVFSKNQPNSNCPDERET